MGYILFVATSFSTNHIHPHYFRILHNERFLGMTDGTHNAPLSRPFVVAFPTRDMHKNRRSGNGIVLYVDTICVANDILVMLFSYFIKQTVFIKSA